MNAVSGSMASKLGLLPTGCVGNTGVIGSPGEAPMPVTSVSTGSTSTTVTEHAAAPTSTATDTAQQITVRIGPPKNRGDSVAQRQIGQPTNIAQHRICHIGGETPGECVLLAGMERTHDVSDATQVRHPA